MKGSLVAYNIAELREMARRRLPKGVFEFVDRGTEDEVALRNNRAAFERIKLKPRVLVDVSGRSQKTTLFGKQQEMPIIVAPTGTAGLLWYGGEVGMAKAAADAGVPFTVATNSMTSMEEISEKAGGRLWFQLYMWSDRALSHKLVERARGVGFEALIVTVDGAVPSNREYNHHNGFEVPIRFNSRNVLDVMKKPGWLTSVFLRQLLTRGMPRFENYPPEIADKITSKSFKKSKILKNETLNWEDIKTLRKAWPGPLVVKGILHPDDAALAAEHGADGVIISNHGGRNLDSSMAPIDVLPEVVDRIGGRKTIIVDSGFRRGSDIVKALALGANAVGIGRATLFGTAAAGEAGAARAIAILREEIDRMLGLTGTLSIDQLNRELLHIEGEENAICRTAGVEDLRLAQTA